MIEIRSMTARDVTAAAELTRRLGYKVTVEEIVHRYDQIAGTENKCAKRGSGSARPPLAMWVGRARALQRIGVAG